MKLLFNCIGFIYFCSLSGVVSAANKIGNGGDGVFCENSKTKADRLLDFYENDPKFSSKESDPQKIAKDRINQLAKFAPKLGQQYARRLSEIYNEIDFKDNIELTDITDSKHLYKPIEKKCNVLQVAIRKQNIAANEKRFLVRQDLWKRLNSVDQAGLLTHEIFYEHFVKLGETDSVKARKVNQFIFRENTTKEDFWRLIKDLDLPIYPN